MSKVELIVPERDVVPVTEALAASDVFHLAKSNQVVADGAARHANEWHERATTFITLEQRILNVMKSLNVDEGLPPSEQLHLIGSNVALRDIELLEQEAEGPVHEFEAAQLKLTQLQRYLSQLEPIAELDVNLGDLRNMRYTFALIGTIPVTNIDRLQSSLEHIPFVLVTLRQEDHLAVVVLFGMQRDAAILNRAARSAYLNPLHPPKGYRGTPGEAIAALKDNIARTQQRIMESQASIDRIHETRIRHLRHLLWRIRASRKLVETIAEYGRLRYTYLITGWVPECKLETLQEKVAEVSDQVVIETSPPYADERVPVVLDNPSLLKSFEGLVTNYGYPAYGELDPTPVVALTYPLVFGIMFGDVGHGLFLFLLGILLLSGAIRSLRKLAGMGGILIGCGIMAMIFGFLYGSIFGFEEILRPLWIKPLEDIMDILIAAVVAGVALLNLGMLNHIGNAALSRQWGKLFFSHNGVVGMAFYWSFIGLLVGSLIPDMPISASVFGILTVITGGLVAFSEIFEHLVDGQRPLIEGGVGTYVMQAFFELFEVVIGLLSNTLSYIRMGAFAVAHGALSLVVFIIADIVSPEKGLGYWVVVVLGNLFVIGFEGMIVAIQTLRLEYYEFFSKFFSGGGEHYHPLKLISEEGNKSYQEA